MWNKKIEASFYIDDDLLEPDIESGDFSQIFSIFGNQLVKKTTPPVAVSITVYNFTSIWDQSLH